MRKILNYISSNIVSRNVRFLNKHKGEECYLIGNGASLKHFDLSQFSDKISFGCNELRIHNDLHHLNLKYYIGLHPLSYCKYWRGVKTGFHIEQNPFYKHTHSFNNNNYEMFVHASNYPFTRDYDKFNYIHNYMKNSLSIDTIDFSSSSSFSTGGLEAMIGLAIYMGFKKIYLVGCDYWFSPKGEGHFYTEDEPPGEKNIFLYDKLLKVISEKVELVVVTRNGFKSSANYIEYSELTGMEENKKAPCEIVSEKYLSTMDAVSYLRG